MAPSQERVYAKVVTLPAKINCPFDFDVVCCIDEDSDGLGAQSRWSRQSTVTVLDVQHTGDRDTEITASRNDNMTVFRCGKSIDCGPRVRLRGKVTQIGIKMLPLVVSYRVSGGTSVYKLLVNVVVRVYNEDMLRMDPAFYDLVLKATSSCYLLPELVPICVPRERPEKSKNIDEKLLDLMGALKIHEGGLNYVNTDSKGSLIKWNLLNDLSPSNYVIKYEAMNCYERRQQGHDLRMQIIKNVEFRKDGNYFILDIDDHAADRKDVRERDKVIARLEGTNLEFYGFVEEVEDTEIVIKFNREFRNFWKPKHKFCVWFELNKYVFKKSSEILRTIGTDLRKPTSSWRKFLFPCREDIPYYDFDVSQFKNVDGGLNPQQREAVQRILGGGGRCVPYIIFGPPGTGKTKTLVAAIEETFHAQLIRKTILVTTSSNAAGDEIAIRLQKCLPPGQVVRLYANSRREELKPKCLKNHYPVPGKIIVCTFVAARFFKKKKYFQIDDLFMDEVGHATELTTLCSVVDLVDLNRSRIVLAGDPRQLGPVVKSKISIEHGMEISLLERLMEREIYLPDPKTKRYDGRVITKLVQNYRSHKDLLCVPNELFYDGDLVPCAPLAVQNAFLGWSELPKFDFPLIFNGIVGQEARGENGVSFYNLEEAVTVVKYLEKVIKKLGPSGADGGDIAILTPYRGQIMKIRSILSDRRLAPKITLGSTEELQGKEKSVVIISTVRSQPELANDDFGFAVGFLKSPKRFNVAVTRAKSLLIVIGNPLVLKEDVNWRTLLNFIIKRGGYTGFKSDTIHEAMKGV